MASSRSRVYKTHALILRRRDYADADRIVTVFTPGMGKLQLIAKGIRKTTSRKAGHLELFTHAALVIAQARTWDIITEATTVENYRHLRGDLDAIGNASYIVELIDAFTEADDENQSLWDLLTMTLRLLDEGSSAAAGLVEVDRSSFDVNVLLRWFELHVLSVAGFQPELFDCIGCGKELQAEANYLSLAEGGVYCPACGHGRADAEGIDVDTLKVLRFLQSRPWREAERLTVRPPIMRRVENVLYRYLIIVLERQLKSPDFLHRLQRMPLSSRPAEG
ncbi:MAG: DNA repair protein RecO [Caldilineaceae bacterium]|nr:DNA repair protein RecO [Caldilineaceae bacterium]